VVGQATRQRPFIESRFLPVEVLPAGRHRCVQKWADTERSIEGDGGSLFNEISSAGGLGAVALVNSGQFH